MEDEKNKQSQATNNPRFLRKRRLEDWGIGNFMLLLTQEHR